MYLDSVDSPGDTEHELFMEEFKPLVPLCL